MKEKLKVVVIILYDSKKRFLLQYRSHDAKFLPSHWAFFGGQIDSEENPFQAAQREVWEELDYKLKNPEFIFEQDFKLSNARGHMWVYTDFFCGDKESLRLKEGEKMGWFTAQETKALKMVKHDRFVIEKANRYIERREQEAIAS